MVFAILFKIIPAKHTALHFRQVVWFDAQVPVRQWNSMCIIRDIKNEKFQIYQNDDLVFSYGECTTIGDPGGTKVANETCIEQEWKYRGRILFFSDIQGR